MRKNLLVAAALVGVALLGACGEDATTDKPAPNLIPEAWESCKKPIQRANEGRIDS